MYSDEQGTRNNLLPSQLCRFEADARRIARRTCVRAVSREIDLLRCTGNRLVATIERARTRGGATYDAGHFVESMFLGRISPPTRLFPNRFYGLAILRIMHATPCLSTIENRLCASARPDGGNDKHRGHGCTRGGIQIA